MKMAIILALVLGVAGGIGGRMACRGHASAQPTDAVVAAPVELVSANGTVEGARPEVALRPEVAGILTVIKAHENDKVAAGEVVAELSNEAQKAQVALARAELTVARQHLKKLEAGERNQVIQRAKAEVEARTQTYQLAEADYRRAEISARGLSAGDLDNYRARLNVARTDLEKAKSDLSLLQEGSREEDRAAARAQVEVAEAKLHAAEAELAKTRLTAPSGVQVLQVFAEPGELASPTSTQPILILADLSKRRVRAFVEELDVSRIDVGQPATVTADGLPGKTFTGKVTVALPRMGKRAPQSDAPNEMKDMYFREVLIDLDGGDELPTNLRVQVRIQEKRQSCRRRERPVE
jgi:multidrug resistance efflux pump